MFPEVWRELHSLPESVRERGEVLEISTLTLMGERRWEEALQAARRLRDSHPEYANSFIHEAYCLHELGRTREALILLRNAPRSLHERAVYFYNIGCYCARLGDHAEALSLLDKAFKMDASLKRSARRDPDLESLKDKL